MSTRMRNSLMSLMFLLLCGMVRAEQPVFTISSHTAETGEIIDVNFMVSDFSNLIAAQLSVNWNPAVLRFRAIKNLNPGVTGLTQASFGIFPSNVDNGRFTMSWFESNVTPVTLPDNSLFLTVEFEVIGAPCQSTAVSITNIPLEIFVSEDEQNNIGLVTNNGTVNQCLSDVTLIGNTQNASCGTQVCIPFTVQNFTDIGSIEFSLSYNPAVLEFSEVKNFADLPAFSEGNTNNIAPGNFRVLWFNNNIENSSLADGTVLFELCFNVVGPGTTQVTFGTDPAPTFTDIDGLEYPNSITPGVVNAACALQGFAFIADTICTEPGTNEVCMDIKVNDFDDIVTFQFDLAWNPAVFEFVRVEGFGLPQLDDDAFGTSEVANGRLTVAWLDFSLEGETVPDFTTIFRICFRPVGNVGQFSPLTFTGEILASTIDDEVDVTVLNGQLQYLQNCDNPPCNVSYVINATSPSCPGLSNGAIDLVVTETCPESPTFQWSANAGGVTTEDVGGLAAGTYMVTITVGSQIVVATQTISNPTPIAANGVITDPIPLGASNGSINLTPTGGTPPYTFVWSTTPPQTGEDLNGVGVGTYIVTITDNNGCQFVPDPFVVGAEIAAQITHVGCPGANNGAINLSASFGVGPYTYVWNTTPVQTTEDISGLSPGIYCVTVTDSQNSTRDTCFTVNDATPLVITANVTNDVNENCGGAIDLNVTGGSLPYTYSWNTTPPQTTQDLIGLCPGQYCVTVTYNNGTCTATQCFTVFAGDAGISLTTTPVSCNGECDGAIDALVIGGAEPYTYRWSNNETTASIDGLCAGTYALTVTDANGATFVASTQLLAPPAIDADINTTLPTDYSSTNGAIAAVVSGGDPPYIYSWTGPVIGSTPALNNLPAGTYTLQVTDGSGCQEFFTVSLLPEGTGCYLGTPVITPNSDGKNDFLIITCVYDAPNVLYIYNRNGGLVYTVSNYDNSWEGTYDDFAPVPDGGYHWVLDVRRPQGSELYKGTVNVLRTAD